MKVESKGFNAAIIQKVDLNKKSVTSAIIGWKKVSTEYCSFQKECNRL